MVSRKGNVYGVSGGGGGSDIDLSGYATTIWTQQNFVSIEYFRKLFRAFDANNNEIVPNNTSSLVNNIKATVGFWTEQYLSALGQGSGGGGGGGAEALSDLLDVELTTLQNGQALIYSSALGKWTNGTAGVNMTQVWSALGSATNEQINVSHLTNALSGYVTTSAISDMATQTWVGQQGFATQTWVTSNFITIAFFDRLFQAYNGTGSSATRVNPNDTTSTIDNIKAMFGFWTELYLSALGDGGASSGSISLGMLSDVSLSSPTDGQALVFDSTLGIWKNGTVSGTDMSTVWTNLAAATNEQINASHLTTALSSYNPTNNFKTINGNSIIGTGDINVGGGGGNYLPLSGGTMTGSILNNVKDENSIGSDTINFLSVYANHYYPGANNNLWFHAESKAAIFRTSGVRLLNNNGNHLYLEGANATTSTSNTTQIVFGTSSDNHVVISSNRGAICINPSITSSSSQVFLGTGNKGCLFPDYVNVGGNLDIGGTINSVANIKQGTSTSAYLHVTNVTTTTDYVELHCSNLDNSRTDRPIVLQNGYGNVGIGVAQPSYKLQVGGTGYFSDAFTVQGIELGHTNEINGVGSSNSNLHLNYRVSGYVSLCLGGGNVGIGVSPSYRLHVSGSIYATGGVTALSDARMKDVKGNLALVVDEIANAPAVEFTWKGERVKEGLQAGTLAQYWQKVLPMVVMDKGGELSMQYGVAALVSSIITARKVVDHERRIAELERENKELKLKLKIA